MKQHIKPLTISAIISILISFVFCYFYSGKDFSNFNFLVRFLMVSSVLFFVHLHFIFGINKLYDIIYKRRYYIAAAIILFCLAFELNNSSIDVWNFINDDNYKISDVIFGKARIERTDECLLIIPMFLSQYPNYPYFNNILRGTKTDMSLIYAQPIKHIVTLFRPFLLGFIFLGSAKGLSFFWIVRLVLLFVIVFELLLLITNKNKKLSLFGTLLITFAPAIHWWFTCNGIIEMIIYCSAIILLFKRYMNINNFYEKLLLLCIIYICMGSFILVLYPAWQVPCMYVFFAIFVWMFFENKNNFKFDIKDLLSIIVFTTLLAIAFYCIYDKSKETLDIITNTIYPGKRSETGGGSLSEANINCGFATQILRYWGNIFLTLSNKNLSYNQCLYAAFFDLFPAGLILSCAVFFKDKNKDKLLILLSGVFVFLSAWCFIGFPKFLADITLLKVSPSYRTIILLGFLNILILIRALSIIKFKFNTLTAGIITLILTVYSVIASKYIYGQYLDIFKIGIIVILSSFMFWHVLKNNINKFFIFVTATIMIIAGLAVNPIQRGFAVIKDAPLARAIKNINTEDPGLWIFETGTLKYAFIMNYPVIHGAATFNSTNIYPNLEGFKKIDKQNEFFYVYNRYCHISVNLVDIYKNTEGFKKFVLLNRDYIAINMVEDDLIDLNIKYILTLRNLSSFNSPKVKYELLFSTSKCAIYKLHY